MALLGENLQFMLPVRRMRTSMQQWEFSELIIYEEKWLGIKTDNKSDAYFELIRSQILFELKKVICFRYVFKRIECV